jgi:hypothetical protein
MGLKRQKTAINNEVRKMQLTKPKAELKAMNANE